MLFLNLRTSNKWSPLFFLAKLWKSLEVAGCGHTAQLADHCFLALLWLAEAVPCDSMRSALLGGIPIDLDSESQKSWEWEYLSPAEPPVSRFAFSPVDSFHIWQVNNPLCVLVINWNSSMQVYMEQKVHNIDLLKWGKKNAMLSDG